MIFWETTMFTATNPDKNYTFSQKNYSRGVTKIGLHRAHDIRGNLVKIRDTHLSLYTYIYIYIHIYIYMYTYI